MNNSSLYFFNIIFIGLGATLTLDLWSLFLKHIFKIPLSNFCLVGRWLLYMPEGIFTHSNIGSVPPKSGECKIGWLTHYLTGIAFSNVFIVLVGNNWLQHPTLSPAILFGVITVLAPFFIMQPGFGFGFAASRTSDPDQTRLRSLMNHTSFGVGLYLFGLIVSRLL